jgi:hypothetical protein
MVGFSRARLLDVRWEATNESAAICQPMQCRGAAFPGGFRPDQAAGLAVFGSMKSARQLNGNEKAASPTCAPGRVL